MLLKNKPCVLTTQGEDRRRKKNCGCNFDFEFFFFFFGKSDNDRQRARELLGLHFRTSELNPTRIPNYHQQQESTTHRCKKILYYIKLK